MGRWAISRSVSLSYDRTAVPCSSHPGPDSPPHPRWTSPQHRQPNALFFLLRIFICGGLFVLNLSYSPPLLLALNESGV